MGSKNRIAKHLLPIMLSEAEKHGITKWVEPFVGGANMIDKVPSSFERVGYDLNPHTIAALIGVRDYVNDFPCEVSEEHFKSLKNTPPNPITSWIRSHCAFGGLFGNNYARNNRGTNYCMEGRRNTLKQSQALQTVELIGSSYEDLDFNNCLIYCDPPYANTSGYKTGAFDHDKFFNWCRKQARDNIVFVSEYNAPDDFLEVWRGEIKTNFSSSRKTATHNAIEKLFRVCKQWAT